MCVCLRRGIKFATALVCEALSLAFDSAYLPFALLTLLFRPKASGRERTHVRRVPPLYLSPVHDITQRPNPKHTPRVRLTIQPQKESEEKELDLYQLLQSFTSCEVLSEDDMYHCSKCKCLRQVCVCVQVCVCMCVCLCVCDQNPTPRSAHVGVCMCSRPVRRKAFTQLHQPACVRELLYCPHALLRSPTPLPALRRDTPS